MVCDGMRPPVWFTDLDADLVFDFLLVYAWPNSHEHVHLRHHMGRVASANYSINTRANGQEKGHYRVPPRPQWGRNIHVSPQ